MTEMARGLAIARLQSRLDKAASPKTKAWWESYLKHTILFRGVKMADIRAALHAWIETEGFAEGLSLADQRDLALCLLRESYAEDKISGILYLQEVLLPAGALDWRSDLARFVPLFEEGHIADWNTNDWLCVKVLGPLVERAISEGEGEACGSLI